MGDQEGQAGGLTGRKVCVLGAGVGGLAVALAAARAGAEVEVIEQAETITEVGAGLQISPNGAAVLQALGLGAALEAISVRAEAVALCDGYGGGTLARMAVGQIDPQRGWHFLHRADLIEILRQGAEAAGVTLRLWHHAAAVRLTGARPEIVLDQGHEKKEILIGADGLHSVTRAALNGAVAPFFTRQAAWRAVIPESGADPVAEVHLGAGRHLVSYPLRGGQWRNIVAVEERDRWVEESWSLRADPLELQLAFESFGPRVRDWLARVETCHLWGLFRHEVAETWGKVLPEGGVAILGDAAHPTLPFLAQGACMALEDGWTLIEALKAHGIAGLPGWQAAREGRCRRIVAAANGNARLWHLGGVSRGVAHLGLRTLGTLAPGALLGKFDWLYRADVTQASPR